MDSETSFSGWNSEMGSEEWNSETRPPSLLLLLLLLPSEPSLESSLEAEWEGYTWKDLLFCKKDMGHDL